jgi:hypothetical protein
MQGCGYDLLRDFYEYHPYWFSLGSVIIYELLMQPEVVTLRHHMLLKVSKLVGVSMSDFALGLPTQHG